MATNLLKLDKPEKAQLDDLESLVDLEVVDEILNSLVEMSVDLDHDPLGGGPTRLQRKMADARNLTTKVQRWYQLVSRADHTLNRALHILKTELEIKEDDLVANDPDVRQMPNQKSQLALAHSRLRDLIERVARIEVAAGDTSHLLKVINAKRADLKDITTRLKDQTRICQDEIQMGRTWGSKVPESSFRLQANPELSRAVADDVDLLVHDMIIGKEGDRELEMPTVATLRVNKEDPPRRVEKPAATPPPSPSLSHKSDKESSNIMEDSQVKTGVAEDALDMLDLSMIREDESKVEDFDRDMVDDLPDAFWDSF